MTEAAVEKIARLMHEESNDFTRLHPERRKKLSFVPFESTDPLMQERYRHVARKVLEALGH